ncbi:hypothetical protein COOONC_10897 [Cooperia oncophora]
MKMQCWLGRLLLELKRLVQELVPEQTQSIGNNSNSFRLTLAITETNASRSMPKPCYSLPKGSNLQLLRHGRTSSRTIQPTLLQSNSLTTPISTLVTRNSRDSIKAVMSETSGERGALLQLFHGYVLALDWRRGLELNRFDCWSTHARAHVIEMQGRFDEGIAFMESTEEDWKRGWMLAAHNYWHNALYYLEKDITEVPLEIYDRQIIPRAKKSGAMLDIVDAASMLWRLELEAIVLREAGAGFEKQEQRLHQTLLDFAENVKSDEYDQARICREVGIPLYNAMAHFSDEEYDDCAKAMLPIRDRIYTIGGSNAQRHTYAHRFKCIEFFSKVLDERNAIKKMSKISERLAYRYRKLHPM